MPWAKNDAAWPGLEFSDRIRQRLLGFCEMKHGFLGCWAWRNDLAIPGRFFVGSRETGEGRLWVPARASYSFFVGDPGALDVLHCCDCRGCCNPLHLYLGTDTENVRDRQQRERSRGRWSTSRVEHVALSDEEFIRRYVQHPAQIAALVNTVRGALPDLPVNTDLRGRVSTSEVESVTL